MPAGMVRPRASQVPHASDMPATPRDVWLIAGGSLAGIYPCMCRSSRVAALALRTRSSGAACAVRWMSSSVHADASHAMCRQTSGNGTQATSARHVGKLTEMTARCRRRETGAITLGIRNVEKAYAVWSTRLGHLPFRVLIWMAYRALDADQSPRYWGGWEELAYAAGRMVPAAVDGDKDTARQRRAALKAISGVMGALEREGAVRVVRPAAPGRNAEYGLMLTREAVHAHREPSPVDDSSQIPVDNSSQIDAHEQNGSRSADTTVHAQPDNGSRSACTTVHTQRAPEEKEEEQEEAQDGTKSSWESKSPPPPDPPAASEEVDDEWVETDAASPAENPLPEKCPHGFRSRLRPDGHPSCALCRRERAGPLATVIPLRRTA